jgi:hypothetical protein
MNKAFIKIQGGLGNQLHCYAFGKAIEYHHNVDVIYDCYTGYLNDTFNRSFNLYKFPNIKLGKIITFRNKYDVFFLKIFIRLSQLFIAFIPLKCRKFIVEQGPYKYQVNLLKTKFLFNPYFTGYWATYKYYNLIKKQLIVELKPNKSNCSIENYYLHLIKSSNSCFLHYRTFKEDVTVKHKSLFEYYEQAINYMNSHFDNIKIFVFSDDILIAKANLPLSLNDCIFIENTNDTSDFYLMNQCNYAIIADSTFSWWAAWLDEDDNKTVIAPKGLSPWGDDWAPDNWVKIIVK